MTIPETDQTPLILVIDDNPNNIRLIVKCLKSNGFRTIVARDGELGIQRAKLARPALILLDVMMPEMDGFETCRRLKSAPETCDIPVIFLTALTGEDDKAHGFDAGGVDYITKPLQQKEVVARVNTHVALAEMRQRLQAQNAQLSALNASKDKFFSIIAHDLRSPFSALLGYSELLHRNLGLYTHAQIADHVKHIDTAAHRLYALLENLLTWAHFQQGMMVYAPRVLNLSKLGEEIYALFLSTAEQKQIALFHDIPAQIDIYADPNMIHAILRNLISNALKFTRSGGEVRLLAQTAPQMIEITVTDTGIGLAAEDLDGLFRIDRSYRRLGTDGESGTGLGLILCQEFVQRHGGTLQVQSQVGTGTTFRVVLPKRQVEQQP